MDLFIWATLFITFIHYDHTFSQPPQAGTSAGAGGSPPPGRGFQLKCTDEYAYADQTDPALVAEFSANAPPG